MKKLKLPAHGAGLPGKEAAFLTLRPLFRPPGRGLPVTLPVVAMVILMTIPFLAGMGSMQGPSSPEKIPVPIKQYHASFVDQMDVATECSEASIEGAIYLEGKRGEGNYTISFDNIEQVLFRMHADRLTGIVKLRAGGTTDLIMNKAHKAYGRTKYGTFQIKLMDLKTMTIAGPPKK
jgi:hypothetical protein